uniref:THD domain-containing protein n=1 Tax=Ciona savignyi TaxID=51511 RepID=H2Z3R2_CIOSA
MTELKYAALCTVLLIVHCGLYVPIGIKLNQILETKKDISDNLSDEVFCMNCCLGLELLSLCDECMDSRIGGNKQCVWNQVKTPKNSTPVNLIDEKESLAVISKAYNHQSHKKRHGRSSRRHEIVNSKIQKLEEIIESPPRPGAYLTSFLTNGPPQNGRSRLLSWSNQRGAGFCFLWYVGYSNESGLSIEHTGKYVVYAHTTFIPKKDSNETAMPRGRCTISHEVEAAASNGRRRTLMKSSETRNCDVKCGHSRNRYAHHNETTVGFTTLHSMGIFKLDQKDQLQVYYHMPPYIAVGWAKSETYFGLFML